MTMDRLEYTTPADVFVDFCLWEYRPKVPFAGKLRSANLLYRSFDVAGMNGRIYDLIAAVRRGFGVSRTVWGIKQLDGRLRWEFYFYDYQRRERERSITKLLEIIRPFIRCGIKANENHFYFMFSIDIDDELISGQRDLDEIHMYIGNPGSSVSSGICYLLSRGDTKLENFYFFFDAKSQMDDIMSKVACSAHIDTTRIPLDQVLWPELKNSRVIVVANKQMNDSVYFSGINVDQLIYFLKRMSYPAELVSFTESNRDNLDHLLFDVGIDYRMVGKDLVFLKSGYYGIF